MGGYPSVMNVDEKPSIPECPGMYGLGPFGRVISAKRRGHEKCDGRTNMQARREEKTRARARDRSQIQSQSQGRKRPEPELETGAKAKTKCKSKRLTTSKTLST